MPELPEVETVRACLARDLIGKKIKSVAVANGRSVRRHKSRQALSHPARGPHDQGGRQRLGKYLLIALDSGDTLVVHLGMSGQLLGSRAPRNPSPSTPTW